MQFHVDGHHPASSVLQALAGHFRHERRDIPGWVIEQAPVRHLYGRAIKTRLDEKVIGLHGMRYLDTRRAGYKPVTLVDFWFPSEAIKAAGQAVGSEDVERITKIMIVGREQAGRRWDEINVHVGDLQLSCDAVNDRTVRLAVKLAQSHRAFFRVFENCSEPTWKAATSLALAHEGAVA